MKKGTHLGREPFSMAPELPLPGFIPSNTMPIFLHLSLFSAPAKRLLMRQYAHREVNSPNMLFLFALPMQGVEVFA
jgi:hypothetical protein